MVKALTFLYILLLCSSAANGQVMGFSITGIVVDSTNGDVVELANVALKPAVGETIIAATTADLDGNFVIRSKPGKYQLEFAFMGYNTKIIPIELKANIKLGKVLMSQSISTLKEAVITAERQEITVDAEKTVLNVAQSPNNQVGTADDVLRNMPGVNVDQDGNISVIGKSGVKVLVDGRPNAMADNDLPGFLKSIPAGSIESIELITNPSARYDAEGNAGIINIKLKKGAANGLNLTASVGIGIINRYNGNVNVNYRINKFNFFTGYSFNQSKTTYKSISDRVITADDTTAHYNVVSNGTPFRFSNNLKAGFDYFADDKTTLTYTVTGNYSHSRQLSNTSSSSLDSAETPLETYKAINENVSASYSLNNNINFQKKFDSTERELDINAGHTIVSSENNIALTSTAFDAAGNYDAANSQDEKTTSPGTLENIMLKVDYVHPLKKLKKHKVEAGVKNETSINKNNFSDYNIVNNTEQFDSLLSNRFSYTQNVAAAYGIFSGKTDKWFSYSGGLRAEHTFITANDDAVNRSYIDFFPSASGSVAFNDTQNLSLSYNRRIQRPPFRYISPAITYSDQFTTWQGNPLLQPSLADNLSLAYSHTYKKQLFVIRTGASFVSDGFTGTSTVDSNRVTRGTEVNGLSSKAWNGSLYMRLHITPWLEAQTYYNVSYTYYGFAPGVNLNPVSGATNNFWGLLRFKFWTNTTFEISGWYNTHNVNPSGTSLPVGALFASIKKTFLKDQLSVSISGNDLLNSMKWRWTNDNPGIQTTGSWQGNNRYATVTISYRFSLHNAEEQKKKEEDEEHTGDGKG
jgi:outer membrane receptor protein involved in Fe transport